MLAVASVVLAYRKPDPAALNAPSEVGASSTHLERSNHYCGNQCRWYKGFFDRTITGFGVADKCLCAQNGTMIGAVPYYTTDHPFDGPPTVPPRDDPDAACCTDPEAELSNCTTALTVSTPPLPPVLAIAVSSPLLLLLLTPEARTLPAIQSTHAIPTDGCARPTSRPRSYRLAPSSAAAVSVGCRPQLTTAGHSSTTAWLGGRPSSRACSAHAPTGWSPSHCSSPCICSSCSGRRPHMGGACLDANKAGNCSIAAQKTRVSISHASPDFCGQSQACAATPTRLGKQCRHHLHLVNELMILLCVASHPSAN